MISYYLMFPVVRSFLVFSGLGVKSPASGFQSYSSSSLKTSPTIQHFQVNGEKILHTEGRHPERFTELHEEEEREYGDRDEQEEKKRDSRGERQIYAVLCSLSVLGGPEHPQRFTELDWEEKGEGGNRGDLREETESQKWERVINTLLSKNGY